MHLPPGPAGGFSAVFGAPTPISSPTSPWPRLSLALSGFWLGCAPGKLRFWIPDPTPVSCLLFASHGLERWKVFPALTLFRPTHSRSRSTTHKFQPLDYVPWQRSKHKIKPSTVLPVLHTSGRKKNKMKTWISDQPGYSKSTTLMTCHLRNPQDLCKGKLDSGKNKFRLMRTLLRSRRTSLQELCKQEDFLIKFNQELIKTIKDMEDSSALKTRGMLQQQDIFGTIINSLGYSNKKKLQQMTCELQEWKEKEESKMSYLKQQVEQLNDKIKMIQEEVNFLSTYMDHEYPVKVVQIANLVHQLEQVKDNQQDELDDFNKIRKMVLESLSEQIQKKRQKLLRSLVAKAQHPRQAVLLQKTRGNQSMVKYTDKYREFINHFEEEIPKLRAEVEQLQVQTQEPREIAFADVLLRRPKCTPDMDVTLNIPVEERLPF